MLATDKKIFVYGSLLKGFVQNSLLGDSKFMGSAKIKGYDMLSLGRFPGLRKSKDADSSVEGEIYQITDESIWETLLLYEGVPRLYIVEQTKAFDSDFVGNVSVFVLAKYGFDPKRKYPIVKNGSWRDFIKKA